MKPPRQIDGADVIEWAWSDVPFGRVEHPYEGCVILIHGLAICQYQNSKKVYRFSCDDKWECDQDSVYESVEQAKQELPEQYREVPALWRRVDQ